MSKRIRATILAAGVVAALAVYTLAAQDLGGGLNNPTAPPDLSGFVRLNAEHTNDYTRFDVSTGDVAFIEKTAGLWLTGADMNTTNQYTAGLYFLSDDSQFTTESPKLLAGIVGRATEAYGSDIDSGMAVDIFASGINAGASDTSELVASFLPTGVALVPPLAFGAGAAIASSDDVCQSDGTNCQAQFETGSVLMEMEDGCDAGATAGKQIEMDIDYLRIGDWVMLSQGGDGPLRCTSTGTVWDTSSGVLPASIRPASNAVQSAHFPVSDDDDADVPGVLYVLVTGEIALARCNTTPNAACSTSAWTAGPGDKHFPRSWSVTYNVNH
jgi:hypothetical protein